MTNPRYTGRQVWNKQRKREILIDVHDVTLGHETKMTWNPQDTWVWSSEIVNPQIIDEETFTAAQQMLAARGRGRTSHKPHRHRHPYVLRGVLYCGICNRRMQGQRNHGAAYYRCRFPEEYALANRVQHPRNVYLREDVLLPALDRWVGRYFAPHRRTETIAAIAAAQGGDGEDTTSALARHAIAECDRKLARYRAALDALDEDTDPAVIARWITEIQQQRAAAEAQLRQTPRQIHLTHDQITNLVNQLGDHTQAIATADPARKADLYTKLGLRLTYHPAEQTVRAEAHLDTRTAWENGSCPRGDLNPHAP
ncbi:recombinase family protein [Actinomadura alba]|uniref:Recombinase family protein n=1 Tax=Actinomadura alba TaxID=406431 RepID=A0ABR7LTA3_9ACTN|nr:recombinase family protein [Actinomadura alba]